MQTQVSFGNNKVSVVYYNDTHGQISNIDGFLADRKKFYTQNAGAKFTLSGGDVFLDTSKHNDITAQKLISATDAVAIGNHDIECGMDYFKKLIKRFHLQGKFLGANLSSSNGIPEKVIAKSKIIKQGDCSIGIIGVAPLDFKKLVFNTIRNRDLEIADIDNTVKAIKKEVQNLEERGINKIFLLAHTGEIGNDGINYYELFAKIGGIDVIIGGHDHKQVDKIEFSNRGEPVKIVSTGRNESHGFGENLDMFGELHLEFDKNGILIIDNCKNIFKMTTKTNTKPIKAHTIRKLDAPLDRSNWLCNHSEIGNLIADSNLWYVNKHTKGKKADFAFVNSGTIRNNFDSKGITQDDVISALPFTISKLIKTELTKKQIIDTLNWCASSTGFAKISPGVMQVSGLEYTINPDLSVSNVHILNKDGSIKCNLDDVDDNEKFTCVYDIFLMTGVAGLKDLKKDSNDNNIEYFDASRQDALFEYLQSQKKLMDYKKIRIIKI